MVQITERAKEAIETPDGALDLALTAAATQNGHHWT
jgi:hypothetical protein